MALSLKELYQPTVLFALALMAVITMMILPMPSWALDLGLAVSFALSILIFTITLFIKRPLDFSAFPTVLLAALMLRLALNVASTKLIIGEGHTGTGAAGGVIEGFALFIMSGNVFLGLVVFLVLLIVNFVVITKGAGRMAEVGARFALDAMPGKQLAIDSDVAAGALGHEEAKERRKIEQEETTFYGSLDGASKFVKGDAIAGLLITALNLIMGLAMGTIVHGLNFGQAVETYSILTVGDGLVSQIPSVITSIAAALLLSKGGIVGTADSALMAQLGGYPAALGTVAGLMALFALAPGLPMLPFMAGGGALALAAWAVAQGTGAEPDEAPPVEVPDARERPLGDLLDVDDIHVRFHPALVPAIIDSAAGLDARIGNMRRHMATEYGFVMPEVRLTDDPLLPAREYRIMIHGIDTGGAALNPEGVMVLTRPDVALSIPGEDIAEPVFGAPARWIPADRHDEAAAAGLPVIAPAEVVATHLLETVKASLGRLCTRASVRRLIDALSRPTDAERGDATRRLIDEFVPDRVPIEALQQVLKGLLDERVPVRNLPLILEATAEGRGAGLAGDALVEHVRRRLAFLLVARHLDEAGRLPIICLDEAWEGRFAAAEPAADGSDGKDTGGPALDGETFMALANAVREALAGPTARGIQAVVATTAARRRFLREVLSAKGVAASVLSFEEIGVETEIALLGTAAAP
ncbi:MAG: FHIPEP family type III secretion protein [Pseudomonadota bacterium]